MGDGLHVAIHQAGPIPLDVEFEVAPNETLALIGPSGAGKTTILRTIAGLYPARQGRIVANGHVWFDDRAKIDVPARQRRVGVVFQSYALFPHLTAIENVMEAMVDRPKTTRHGAAVELLGRVHLDGFADRRPDALSGGQQQRVALARALARDPDVLLFDEPFSAVDRPTRRALHRLIAELRTTTPVPIVFVTHDIEDVAASADRVCFLRTGVVVETQLSSAIQVGGDSHLEAWLDS
ncbi:sulfate/molybdate ABC transporter ATP-binding protein [Sphingomonas sp. 179-A 2A2 NHS]|uniref:sulfate/molybdate ABC transporter ATP-binding protein n=1 Tax=Sphingomonas sp. 179-A 2A2 NHS TaxID=3374290 RepID=UPI0038790F87